MRARSRILLAVTAVAASVLLALLLLWEEGRPGVGEPAPVRGRRESSAGESLAARPLRTPSESPPAEVPVPGGPRLEFRAVVGEWGLAGVQVLAAERFRDGTLVASIADDAPEGGETDAEGRITLQYTTEPAERLFGVLPDKEAFEGAENAEDAGRIGSFRVFRALSMGPVTLRYRDAQGVVLLRPVDAATGEPLASRGGLRIAGRTPGDIQDIVDEPPVRKDGWVVATEPGPENLRLIIPGYLPAPAPDGGWKGRRVVPMEADPRAVRGRLFMPVGGSAAAWLESAVDGRTFQIGEDIGLPHGAREEGFHTFALPDVPVGSWDLVVRAAPSPFVSLSTQWARVRFSFMGEAIDLGEIRTTTGARIRARLLGTDGRPEETVPMHAALVASGSRPLLCYGKDRKGPTVAVDGGAVGWSGGSITREPGDEGWVEFDGLLPGGEYLVASGKVPGLLRTVKAPAAGDARVVSVELDARGPMTACTLRFTVEGQEPRFWKGFRGPALPESFHSGKGMLEADIPPGRYRLALGAGFADEDSEDGGHTVWSGCEGEVEIPDAVRFEATVDLKRRAR